MKGIRPEVWEESEIIRFSGEIPEVAYWNSIYYLEDDPEGPCLRLNDEEKRLLKRAVIERYLTIILRDLTVANIGKSHYRGLERAMVNWGRLSLFAKREGFSKEAIRQKVLEFLRLFLDELKEKDLALEVDRATVEDFIRSLSFNPQALL